MMRASDRSKRRSLPAQWLAVSVLGLSGLSGCQFGPKAPEPSPVRLRFGSPKVQGPSLVEQARASLSSGELQQHDNGFGLMLADPEAAGPDAALRSFGRGCARWLRFTVGGHGELGRTPLWMSGERALLQLERRKARVTLDEAARFANTTGATHAALGRISGTPANCTLVLEVYSVPDRKPLGAVRATGSTEQITSQLPTLARELSTKLGISQPRVPEKVEESADDLAFLGELPRTVNEVFTPAQEQRLAQLADRTLLAAHMAVDHSSTTRDLGTMTRRADQVAAKAPDHPLVWSTIGQSFYYLNSNETPAGRREAVEALVKRYPHNFNACMAKVFMHYPGKTYKDSIQLTEEAIRCSTTNPDAWSMLAQLRSSQANEIRQGRDARKITAAEWEILPELYDRWLEAAQRQMQLDPEMDDGWRTVATAATFASEDSVAIDAIWKALNEPSPSNTTFWWAFEMFDPKWFGDGNGQRLRVAKRATQVKFHSPSDRTYVARLLNANGFPAQAKALLPGKGEQQALTQPETHVHSQLIEFYDSPLPTPREQYPVVKTHPDHVQALYEHPRGARCVAWSPDGEQLASGGKDYTVRLWRWPSGEPRTLSGHTRAVNAVAWNADGSRVASAGMDGTTRIWDARTGQAVKVLSGNQPVYVVAWSPDGKTLATGGEDRLIRLWDAGTGAPQGVLRGHEGRIRHLSYSPDGRYLASAADEMSEKRIWIWGTGAAHPVKRYAGELLPFYSLAWSPDGKVLAAGCRPNLLLISPEAEQPEDTDLPLGSTLGFVWSTDPGKILTIDAARKFYLLDLEGKQLVDKKGLEEHTRRAQAFAWNPKRQRLATAGTDGQVLLWDLGKTPLQAMR